MTVVYGPAVVRLTAGPCFFTAYLKLPAITKVLKLF